MVACSKCGGKGHNKRTCQTGTMCSLFAKNRRDLTTEFMERISQSVNNRIESPKSCRLNNLCLLLNDSFIHEILSFLNKRSLQNCSLLSRQFFNYSTDSSLRVWKKFAIYKSHHFARLILPRYSKATSCYIEYKFTPISIQFPQQQQQTIQYPTSFEFLALNDSSTNPDHDFVEIISPTTIISKQTNLKELVLIELPGVTRHYISILPAPYKLMSLYIHEGLVSGDCLQCIARLCPNLQDFITFKVGGYEAILEIEDISEEDYDAREDEVADNGTSSFTYILSFLSCLSASIRRLEIGDSRPSYFKATSGTITTTVNIICNTLKEVCLGDIDGLDDRGLAVLVAFAPKIEKLDLKHTIITREGFLSSIGCLPQLRYLGIKDNWEAMFLSTDIEQLASNLKAIEFLYLTLTDEGRSLTLSGKADRDFEKDCEAKFLNHYAVYGRNVKEIEFSLPFRGMYVGRQHAFLTWFDNVMESEVRVVGRRESHTYPASEVHFFNSLRDFSMGSGLLNDGIYVRDGQFTGNSDDY